MVKKNNQLWRMRLSLHNIQEEEVIEIAEVINDALIARFGNSILNPRPIRTTTGALDFAREWMRPMNLEIEEDPADMSWTVEKDGAFTFARGRTQ